MCVYMCYVVCVVCVFVCVCVCVCVCCQFLCVSTLSKTMIAGTTGSEICPQLFPNQERWNKIKEYFFRMSKDICKDKIA